VLLVESCGVGGGGKAHEVREEEEDEREREKFLLTIKKWLKEEEDEEEDDEEECLWWMHIGKLAERRRVGGRHVPLSRSVLIDAIFFYVFPTQGP
jgi:hypothetical protein